MRLIKDICDWSSLIFLVLAIIGFLAIFVRNKAEVDKDNELLKLLSVGSIITSLIGWLVTLIAFVVEN